MQTNPQWKELLRQAVEEPGKLSEAYSAFHSYSIGNQIAAWSQCLSRGVKLGPIATYPKWKSLGRHVKRGEKALVLCMPVTLKRTREDSQGNETETVFNRFIWRPSWFTVHQTEGEPYEPPTPNPWDKAKALDALGILEEPFSHPDGNCQGYARGKTIAVSPVAAMPWKTTFHEVAHVVLGHTAENSLLDDGDRTPRSEREIEAECVAYLQAPP